MTNTRRFFRLALLGLVACGTAGRSVSAPAPGSGPVGETAAVEEAIPLWPEVTHGRLANGLSYSILHHEKPEKRAFLWLAVNAGSVLEDEDQRGLAHFDEHMAFDGTAHFEKSAIIDYIEKIGMRFGADLNAYTSFDQTVYELEVPTDDKHFLSRGLDVLRDWASEVTYDPAEVERERGVVLEEWRLGRGANQRLFDKQAKVLFAGTRYADRLTIGLDSVIKTAPREALLRFYKDFYRPDLMSVIVGGDVEPKWIEQEIATRFSGLKNPSNERARGRSGEITAKGTRISIESDHELQQISATVYNLIPERKQTTLKDLRRSLVEQLYSSMLSERLDEVRRAPDSPLRSASAGIFSLTREIDAFARAGEVKSGKVDAALRALFTEVLRVEKHGFGKSELERGRAQLARGYEESIAREKTASSRSLTEELVRNFLTGEFVVGAQAEGALAASILPSITLDELNAAGAPFSGDKNRVILISGPDQTKLPDQAQVGKLVAEVEAQPLEAWDEGSNSGPLMASAPKPGTITAEKQLSEALGITEWRLSNGARVIVKPTDFEADSVIVQGFAPGGTALASDKEFNTARFAFTAVEEGGVGAFNPVALRKVLTGKNASAILFSTEQERGVFGGGSAKDLETALQLLYLRATAPRGDPAAFTTWKTSALERYAEQLRSPAAQFDRLSTGVLFNSHLRRIPPTAQDLEPLQLDPALAYYKDQLSDFSGFTFLIVGSVELPSLKPLVETYLASLPGGGKAQAEKDVKARKVAGVVEKTWKLGEAPKASVSLDFHGDEGWSRDKERDLFILSRVLQIRLREVLRNDLGGVYGVSAGGGISRSPHQERSFAIHFGCDPNNVDKLVAATRAALKEVKEHGATEAVLAKVREAYLRERETSLRQNGYWAGRLATLYRYGDDPALILDSASTIARMTPANVQAAAKLFLDDKQVYEAIMLPEKAVAAPAAK
jgi:zinc protease